MNCIIKDYFLKEHPANSQHYCIKLAIRFHIRLPDLFINHRISAQDFGITNPGKKYLFI